jgi:hypothetical protein
MSAAPIDWLGRSTMVEGGNKMTDDRQTAQ